MATFILGLFIGALLGMIVLSMCVTASRSDRKALVETHVSDVEEHVVQDKETAEKNA